NQTNSSSFLVRCQHPELLSHISEGSVAVVSVKVLSPEIVHHIKVWPTVAVVVAPSAVETEAVIVLVETGGGRHVAECSVAIVPQEKIGWAVLGIIIGGGRRVVRDVVVVSR